MKKLIIILVLVLLYPLTSKEQTYFPFPDSNAIWNEVLTDMQPYSIDNYQYGIYGDTIFNSLTYHKIYLLKDTLYPLNLGQYYASIREDDQKRIYIINCQNCFEQIGPEEEVILYDFSKNVGDTVFVGEYGYGPLFYYIVDYMDSILIDGTYRRTIHFVYYDDTEYWIEGIGSTRGLFSPIIPETTGSLKWDLICFNQDGIAKYLNPAYSSCFPLVTGINEEDAQSVQLQVNPNPVTGTSTLDLSPIKQDIINMSIYNILGVKIKQYNPANRSEVEISKHEYLPGIYFFTITLINHREISGKFVVAD